MLVANLGLLPLDFNIDTLYKIIKDDVYDVTGIQTEVKDIKSSGIVIIDEIKDKEYMKLLDNKRTVNLSYRTRYYKLKDAYDKLLEQQSKLEDYIKKKSSVIDRVPYGTLSMLYIIRYKMCYESCSSFRLRHE